MTSLSKISIHFPVYNESVQQYYDKRQDGKLKYTMTKFIYCMWSGIIITWMYIVAI